MSKPTTMADRAAAYIDRITGDDKLSFPAHLAQFASREVARVREEQAMPLRQLRGAQRSGTGCYVRSVAITAIDAATRPERAVRAKVHKCKAGPTCHVCQGIAAKAMRDEAKKGAR